MAEGNWTILEVLDWTRERFQKAGIMPARLEAELLLAGSLGVDRMRLYLDFDRPLVPDELARFREGIRRRLNHEPLAYILGTREFYSLSFRVDDRVLIPRPETELLVDLAIEMLKDCAAPRVVDVGTGCGAVAVAVAKHLPRAHLLAVDSEAAVLEVADENVRAHEFERRVVLRKQDLLSGSESDSFDLVVSNPPYIRERDWEDLMPEVRLFEPRSALLAGEDGLDVIRKIVQEAPTVLTGGGFLLFEIGADQGSAASRIVESSGSFSGVAVHKDLVGRDRAVIATKNP